MHGWIRWILAAAALASVAGCAEEDASRPGSPRTDRTPIEGAPFPYVEPEAAGVSADALWMFKERLYARIVARHVVGAEVLVLVDGRIVLHQAMGWADRDDLTAMPRNSIFRLASMTKPVTGTVALALVDEGRLSLDEPVGAYLDSFRSGPSSGITVRQLLTHRSGFVQGGEPAGYRDAASLSEAVALAAAQGPTFEPGTRFVYSDLNSDAIGAVVESITGQSIETLVRQRVLDPLGMEDTHTEFDPSVAWAPRVPSSYRSWGGTSWERWWNPSRPHETSRFSPAGGLFGSAFDYARFLRAWMSGSLPGGARFLDAGTVEAALADPVAADTLPRRPRWYGLHWEIYAAPRAPGELPAFGHRGATGTVGMAIPARKAIVIYMTNSNENEVVEEVIDLALEMFGS